MLPYLCKSSKLSGSDYSEISKKAHRLLHEIEKLSRRRPYLRSIYFNKEKIFLDYFWPHLNQKYRRDRINRLRYLSCAIELIKHSTQQPVKKMNPNKTDEFLYRFSGVSKEKDLFFVQIKEDAKTKQKYFMSVFPAN